MTLDWISELGLSEADRAFLLEKWEAREKERGDVISKLQEELESPFRAAGLAPGESRDGLPETDGFLAGLRM